jgi:hypothetical protein
VSVQFEQFWDVYPRKVNKQAARTAWKKAIKVTSPAELIKAVTSYAASRVNEDERYTLHASTWLNGQRWLDERACARNGQPQGGPYARHFEDLDDSVYNHQVT